MAKIPLSLSRKYVPTWGIEEVVRETIQNALDGEDDGFPMSVEYGNGVLRVRNEGARLSTKVLLLGNSTKSATTHRGHFGEGLALSLMVAAREGLDLKVINRDESWTPKIEFNQTFDDDSVTVHTHQRQIDSGFLTVEIPMGSGLWDRLEKRFLKLSPAKNVTKTAAADILEDEDRKGQVFVRGIYVMTDPKLEYGYNLHDVATDRDRKIINHWDLRYKLSYAWQEAALYKTNILFGMLENDKSDIASMGTYMDATAKTALVTEFTTKYGTEAVAVRTMAEAREAEHIGRRAVVVPDTLVGILESEMGTLTARKDEHEKSVTKRYSWSDLSDMEKGRLNTYLPLFDDAAKKLGIRDASSRFNVVDFGSEKILGLHKGGDIFISRKVVMDASPREFIATFIHEMAHDEGGDASASHERMIEALSAEVIAGLVAVIM
jgi:hypothetical protein